MQSDNAANNRINASSSFSAEAENFLVLIKAYKDAIHPISQTLLFTPMAEIVRNPGIIQNVEQQIADIIDNLENLRGNPLGKKFNKAAVLKALNNARVELNKAFFKAQTGDPSCFEHLVECRGYLNLAMGLIPSVGG